MLHLQRDLITAFLFLLLMTVASVTNAERLTVPTPPGGGVGQSVYAPDEAIPLTGAPAPDWLQARDAAEEQALKNLKTQLKAGPYDDIGGDDLLFASAPDSRHYDIDIATNGDIYIAFESNDPFNGWEIHVYRSQDGGDSFVKWGELSDPGSGEGYSSPSLVVAEGTQDRLYIAYCRHEGGNHADVRMSYAELSDAAAVFSPEIMAMESDGAAIYHPNLACDSETYDSYYLYLVADNFQSDGNDILFARCTNYGASFEDPYVIASLSVGDRDYRRPRVCWGYGGWVHVAWYFTPRTDDIYTDAIRYRRVPNSAAGGLANWENIMAITSATNDINEHHPRIAASQTSGEVVIGYLRSEDYTWDNSAIQASLDSGASFSVPETELAVHGITDLIYQPATEDFVMGTYLGSMGLRRASRLALDDWGPIEYFGDGEVRNGTTATGSIAIDPSRDDRIAMPWFYIGYDYDEDVQIYFDAEWRRDPGYPNFEDGFPVDLPYAPISPPAVVDLDGDGDLEIVFSDAGHYIRAYNHDGTPATGWPVYVPAALSDGPVAIGKMTLTDDMHVLVGTTDSQVYGYSGTGEALPGFPYTSAADGPVYVSIGAVGGPYPRMAVVVGGRIINYINHRGVAPEGVNGWVIMSGEIQQPAAIGDVDGDGISEAVVAATNRVYGLPMRTPSAVRSFSRALPVEPSDAPTLGDLDLDGDLEIVVPCVDGTLYVLEHTGADMAGWPQTTSSASPLTSAAIANIVGGGQPEIACAAQDWTVECFYSTGGNATNFPVTLPTTWYLFGAPILTRVDDVLPSEVVIGSRDANMWSWNNFAQLTPGWPKYDSQIQLSPASGDIDGDGSNEIVFLSMNRLLVVDVNSPPNVDSYTWPMYGHDPQRTGCSDCPEDIVTAVESDDVQPTRVSFAAPSPNPAAGSTLFSYSLPVRSQVRLEVYDIRGRRIKTVLREEQAAGPQVIGWNCRDHAGRPVASGTYFAKLRVRGPGVRQALSRKINVIR